MFDKTPLKYELELLTVKMIVSFSGVQNQGKTGQILLFIGNYVELRISKRQEWSIERSWKWQRNVWAAIWAVKVLRTASTCAT
jgi:hypothetical protein